MLVFKEGNMLESDADVLINPVNVVGVMGAGLALQFKQKNPWCVDNYVKACKEGILKPGGIVTSYNYETGKRVIHLATKDHWRNKSNMLYIISGLKAIRKKLDDIADLSNEGYLTVAIPKIGCGLGGLNWDIVKRRIYNNFHDYPGDVYVYEY